MTQTRHDPLIPLRLTDPRPVVTIGTLAWLVITAVVFAAGDRWQTALPICFAGLAVGALGFALFLVQRAAARRGSKGAQRGLS
ncbi:DUF2530 domain-containing protein [Rhodococcus daqingensis]|uniref:DUF2530 domain-containing protein n=1 Tax=Rhodococcus daqingensis TaxID=2479363 RepID=A0ABW2RWE4_9NOCA